jgi:hypothetical protein
MAHSGPEQTVTFDTTPYEWSHWKVEFDGSIATVALNIQEIGRASCRERV